MKRPDRSRSLGLNQTYSYSKHFAIDGPIAYGLMLEKLPNLLLPFVEEK